MCDNTYSKHGKEKIHKLGKIYNNDKEMLARGERTDGATKANERERERERLKIQQMKAQGRVSECKKMRRKRKKL